MTSTYQSKVGNLEVGGVTFTTPTTQGSGNQFLQTNGSGATSWQYLTGNNPQGGSSRVLIHARRIRGQTTNALTTAMIERSSVLFGSQFLSGNPAGDNLFWDTFTVPTGYDGIFMFILGGWKCGTGGSTYNMRVTRPPSTVLFDQTYNYSTNDCGTVECPIIYNSCLAGDLITFRINENNGSGSTLSITNGASIIGYSGITGIWFSTRELYRLDKYLTCSNKYYSTGTASQTGTTITGSGTIWTDAMVGGIIVFHTTNEYAFIINRISNTQITANISQSIASTSYTILYSGVQFDATGLLATNTLISQNTSNQIAFGGTNNNATIINAPPPSGTITISYPTTTSTQLVGTNEIATLTNKTLTNPVINTTGTITNSTVTINTNALDTSRTSPTLSLIRWTGAITEVARSGLTARTGGAATGWTVTNGTLQAGAANNNYGGRILVIGNGGYLTYTTQNNLSPGVYKITYRTESENNRGIGLYQYQVDGGALQTFRTFDCYYSLAWGSFLMEDYFVVTTSGNPFSMRITCNGKNASSAAFIVGVCSPFSIYKMG